MKKEGKMQWRIGGAEVQLQQDGIAQIVSFTPGDEGALVDMERQLKLVTALSGAFKDSGNKVESNHLGNEYRIMVKGCDGVAADSSLITAALDSLAEQYPTVETLGVKTFTASVRPAAMEYTGPRMR